MGQGLTINDFCRDRRPPSLRLGHLGKGAIGALGCDMQLRCRGPRARRIGGQGAGNALETIIKAGRKGDNWLADRIYSGVPAGMFGREQTIEIGVKTPST